MNITSSAKTIFRPSFKALSRCWPLNVIGEPDIIPWSFKKAIIEPENVVAPTAAPIEEVSTPVEPEEVASDKDHKKSENYPWYYIGNIGATSIVYLIIYLGSDSVSYRLKEDNQLRDKLAKFTISKKAIIAHGVVILITLVIAILIGGVFN